MQRCPCWCVSPRVDRQGRLVHLGKIVEVMRTRPAAESDACFQLRLAAADGMKPLLLLDGVAVGTDALLTEMRSAAGAHIQTVSVDDGGRRG